MQLVSFFSLLLLWTFSITPPSLRTHPLPSLHPSVAHQRLIDCLKPVVMETFATRETHTHILCVAGNSRVLKFDFAIVCRGVGCIFFEMASGRPLFPGSTVEDQLQLIFSLLGKTFSFRLKVNSTLLVKTACKARHVSIPRRS